MTEPVRRTLVVDASLNRRIAAELKGRGLPAVAVGELGLGRARDPELLRGLGRRLAGGDWVLVTADDWLPAEQADLLDSLGLTVATVEWKPPAPAPTTGPGSAPVQAREQLARETCHRWAHIMVRQSGGTIRRYSPQRHRTWTSHLA